MTRPFRYDLNQIPNNYTGEVRNRFKGLDLIDRQSSWWTMDRGSWHCIGDRNRDHSQEKEMQKGKMVVWGGLKIAEKRRKAKSKGEKKRYTHLNAREFQKNIYFCFIDYAKAFDCVGHNKLWKILKKIGIPDHLTCLLRNLYAGQEATVRTGHGTTDWSQIGKGVRQGCMLSPCLFNLYAEYIMRNAGLDEAQAGIKIAGNINNLRYVDDTTFMAES